MGWLNRSTRGSTWQWLGLIAWLSFCPVVVAQTVSRNPRFENIATDQGLPQVTVGSILQDHQGFMWFGTQAGLVRFDGYRFTLYHSNTSDPHALGDNFVQTLVEDDEGRIWGGTRGGLYRLDAQRSQFQLIDPKEPASRGFGDRDVWAVVGGAPGQPTSAIWVATADGLQQVDTKTGAIRIWHHIPGNDASLGNDDIRALCWDDAGHLWLGTASGLDRFTPATGRFEHIHLDDGVPPDTRRNTVQALLWASDHRLWIGTLAGLATWKPGDAASGQPTWLTTDGFNPGEIRTIYQDHGGSVWVGARKTGLYRWDAAATHFTAYRHYAQDPQSLAADDVQSLWQDRSGTLWIGTWTGGVSRLDLGSGGFERYIGDRSDPATLNNLHVYGIAGDGHGGLWLATQGAGVEHLDPRTGSMRAYRHNPADPTSLVDDDTSMISDDHQGRVWVATDSGFGRLDPESGRFTIIGLGGNSPALNDAVFVLPDRDGSIWVGTVGGLFRYDPATGKARLFRHDPADKTSLAQGNVNVVMQDRSGVVWVGTDTALDRFEATTSSFTHFRHDVSRADSLSNDRISDIFQDREGRLWVATAGGLNVLQHVTNGVASFRTYTVRDGLDADPIGKVLEDASGHIWVSTTAGISRIDPAHDKVRNYTARDGLITGSFYIRSGHASQDGRLSFGGVHGVVSFLPDQLRDNAVPPTVVITELRVFNQPVSADKHPQGVTFTGTISSTGELRLSHAVSEFSLEFAALHYADPSRNRYAHQLSGFDSDWVYTDADQRTATYTNLDPGHYVFRVKAANKDGVWNETAVTLPIIIAPPWWATWWFRTLAALSIIGAVVAVYRLRVRSLRHRQQWLEHEVTLRTSEVVDQKERLEQDERDLSVLGEVGREITAVLVEDDVCRTLDRHVHGLLDATSFAIFLLDADGKVLTTALRMEQGKALPVNRIELVDPTANTARCARERRELLIEKTPADNPVHYPGTLQMFSQLFAPLMIGERLLGVMTIQSPQQQAYDERDRMVFRTLCAYGAIALDNAAAYRRLAETDTTLQRTLREQQVIYDNAAAAIFLVKDRVIHRCNRGMEEMLGYAAGELVGKSTAICHPSRDAWEAQSAQIDPLIAAGKVATGECEFIRKNGDRLWITFQTRAIDPQHPGEGSIWVANDISERKRSETLLVEGKQQIEQMHRHVSLLSELSGFLQACPRVEEGYACIADYGPRLFPGSLGALYLLEDAGDTLVEKAFWGNPTHSATRVVRFGSGECWALRRGQPYRVDSPSSALCCPHVDRLTGNHRPYSCVPLLAQGKTFGLLFVEHRRPSDGHALDVPQDLVLAMAEHAGLALANIRLREALLQQSIRDPLTGLYNRRHLHEFLQRELARSQREASQLSVMMLDVDHFKQFNDTFGHQAGDEVLQSVAKLIETLFRGHDIGCRYGGEEFILLLPGCSLDRARERAIDLLDAVRSLRLTHEDRVLGRITASIGLAQFPQDGDTPAALIAAADAALYEAKAAGRDRLAIAVTNNGAR